MHCFTGKLEKKVDMVDSRYVLSLAIEIIFMVALVLWSIGIILKIFLVFISARFLFTQAFILDNSRSQSRVIKLFYLRIWTLIPQHFFLVSASFDSAEFIFHLRNFFFLFPHLFVYAEILLAVYPVYSRRWMRSNQVHISTNNGPIWMKQVSTESLCYEEMVWMY